MMDVPLSRRAFLSGMTALTAVCGFPRLALAFAPTPKRLLLIIQRGAMDGLGAVVPYGDRAYADARGAMALPQHADLLTDLDGHFAMHASLGTPATLFKQGECLVLHATATPYRERSHFDAQDLLENGGDRPHSLHTGWLNRAIASLGPAETGIALGPSIPLILQGNGRVTSWDPSRLPQVDDDFLARVAGMYRADPVLSRAVADAVPDNMDGPGGNGGQKPFIAMMAQAARFLSSPDGPHIGTIDIGGWDTHTNQGLDKGRLPNALALLSDGLAAFQQGMGALWKDTAILVVTEFGRTVRGNGTGGTDHGTASAAFLMGGNVQGGRVIGDWPGLNKLYQDRDLYPANDLRALIKGVLRAHLNVPDDILSSTVFPGSSSVAPSNGLFRI